MMNFPTLRKESLEDAWGEKTKLFSLCRSSTRLISSACSDVALELAAGLGLGVTWATTDIMAPSATRARFLL